jgi:hypothetical protein
VRLLAGWILLASACEAPTSTLDSELWFEPLQRTSNDDWVALEDGPLWLLLGPEGGSLAQIGVDVHGSASLEVEVEVEFRGRTYRRDLDLSRDDLREHVIIPVCPPYRRADDPTASSAPLTMTARDLSGASASARALVTPTCAESEYVEFCRRTCDLE